VDHYILAYILAQVTNGDEMYLTLGTGGIYDPKVIAILDSVPRVTIDDWFIDGLDPVWWTHGQAACAV